jgi:hypothetical protein
MKACCGGTDVMERSCAMARGKDINNQQPKIEPPGVFVCVSVTTPIAPVLKNDER